MAKNKSDFTTIAEEALQNIRKDREKVLEQIEKLKDVFNVDISDPSTMNAAMLIGGNLTKLLEQLTKNNEQLVRLAQIKERSESKIAKDSNGPISIKELLGSDQESFFSNKENS